MRRGYCWETWKLRLRSSIRKVWRRLSRKNGLHPLIGNGSINGKFQIFARNGPILLMVYKYKSIIAWSQYIHHLQPQCKTGRVFVGCRYAIPRTSNPAGRDVTLVFWLLISFLLQISSETTHKRPTIFKTS